MTRMTSPSRPSRRVTVAALVGSALLLTGCGGGVIAPTETPRSSERLEVSNCGREVVISDVPKAVIGMHPAQTELLLRLGLAERIVGQAQATAQDLPDDLLPLAADIPVIGGAMPPQREDLLAADADFVYSPTTYEFSAEQGFASIEQLNAAGTAVYVATGGCQERRMTGEVTDLFDDLENLGEIFDVQSKAKELIAENQAMLDDVTKAISGVTRLRVAQIYFEGGTLQAIGAGIEYDILKRAGSDNVYTPEQETFSGFFAATITPESLAAEEPDAIVFAAYDEEHAVATREYLVRTFPDLPAVKNNKLIRVSSSDMFPGTLGNISAVRQIAQALYPDAF